MQYSLKNPTKYTRNTRHTFTKKTRMKLEMGTLVFFAKFPYSIQRILKVILRNIRQSRQMGQTGIQRANLMKKGLRGMKGSGLNSKEGIICCTGLMES